MSIQCRVEINSEGAIGNYLVYIPNSDAFSVQLPAVLLLLVLSLLLVMGTLGFRYLTHEYRSFSVVLSLYLYFENLLLFPTPLPTPSDTLMTLSLH